MTRARAALLLCGMFVLGAACGVFATAAFMHHMRDRGFSHERMERFVVRRLTHRLDLDESQQKTLQDVVHRTREKLEGLHEEIAPRIDAILDDAYHELLPILSPDQQKKLDEVRAEARDRLHRHAHP